METGLLLCKQYLDDKIDERKKVKQNHYILSLAKNIGTLI
jgi:hypothetical protein